jgi:hypothetical protein
MTLILILVASFAAATVLKYLLDRGQRKRERIVAQMWIDHYSAPARRDEAL